jgi:hypothetical protein
MHRQPSTNGTTTAHLAAFLDPSFPSPIGTGIGGPTNAAVGSGVGRARAAFPAPPAGSGSDPSAAVTHHLNALNSLLNPLIGQQDEIIRLRAEVELWRGEWQRCDRERRRLEDAINMKNNEPVDGPAFSVVLLDGDGFIVS